MPGRKEGERQDIDDTGKHRHGWNKWGRADDEKPRPRAQNVPSRNCLIGIVPDDCKQSSKRGSRRNLDMLRFA